MKTIIFGESWLGSKRKVILERRLLLGLGVSCSNLVTESITVKVFCIHDNIQGNNSLKEKIVPVFCSC